MFTCNDRDVFKGVHGLLSLPLASSGQALTHHMTSVQYEGISSTYFLGLKYGLGRSSVLD